MLLFPVINWLLSSTKSLQCADTLLFSIKEAVLKTEKRKDNSQHFAILRNLTFFLASAGISPQDLRSGIKINSFFSFNYHTHQ